MHYLLKLTYVVGAITPMVLAGECGVFVNTDNTINEMSLN